jgi:hypothetical protein
VLLIWVAPVEAIAASHEAAKALIQSLNGVFEQVAAFLS